MLGTIVIGIDERPFIRIGDYFYLLGNSSSFVLQISLTSRLEAINGLIITPSSIFPTASS